VGQDGLADDVLFADDHDELVRVDEIKDEEEEAVIELEEENEVVIELEEEDKLFIELDKDEDMAKEVDEDPETLEEVPEFLGDDTALEEASSLDFGFSSSSGLGVGLGGRPACGTTLLMMTSIGIGTGIMIVPFASLV
jgi:hypothetical protein